MPGVWRNTPKPNECLGFIFALTSRRICRARRHVSAAGGGRWCVDVGPVVLQWRLAHCNSDVYFAHCLIPYPSSPATPTSSCHISFLSPSCTRFSQRASPPPPTPPPRFYDSSSVLVHKMVWKSEHHRARSAHSSCILLHQCIFTHLIQLIKAYWKACCASNSKQLPFSAVLEWYSPLINNQQLSSNTREVALISGANGLSWA